MAYKIYGTNQPYGGKVVNVGNQLFTTRGGALEGNSYEVVLVTSGRGNQNTEENLPTMNAKNQPGGSSGPVSTADESDDWEVTLPGGNLFQQQGSGQCPPGQHWMPSTNGQPGYCMEGESHAGQLMGGPSYNPLTN
tara:strand:+ start:308 stop:715 length:408 start_codon:yes stop_codon:yes gene_type:complete